MDNQIAGMLTYEENECPFIYCNGVLSIDYNNSKKAVTFLEDKAEIKEEILLGKISGKSEFIYFYIDKNRKQWSMNSQTISNFCLKVVVKSYAIMSNPIFPAKFQLFFSNVKFAKWLRIHFQHTSIYEQIKQEDEKWYDNRFIDLSTSKMRAEFTFKDFKILVKPSFCATRNLYETKLMPGLLFECTGCADLPKITELCKGIHQFLQFSFHREFVECGEIVIKMHTLISKDLSTWLTIGNIHIPFYDTIEMNNPKIGDLTEFGFIEWENLYQHVSNIFNSIEQGFLYLYNLPEKNTDRNLFSLSTVSKDAAAFEFHFSKIYQDLISSKIQNHSFVLVKEKLEDFLKEEKDTEVRNFLIRTIDSISQMSFKEKILYVLDDLNPILKKYIDCEYKTDYETSKCKIANEFRNVRNKVHGCSSVILSDEEVNANFIIRILIFAMQLKQLGFNESESERAIQTVFELRI